MKYTSLQTDIVNILRSSDNELKLKLYDENGNTTLNGEDAVWVYIFNENIMVEFMTDDNPVIYFWKENKNINPKFKHIIQRIRELAILNGVSVQIRVYDNLNQRKIYNLIKNSITMNDKKEEDEEMTESVNPNKPLIEAFKNIITTAKLTNKPSDFYLSEEMKTQQFASILSEMFSQIKSLESLSNLDLTETFNRLSTSKSIKEIEEIIESLSSKSSSKLLESVDSINGIASFVKQQYENNVDFGKPTKNIMVLENVKVYEAKIKNNRENLVNAYNELLKVSEGALSGIQLLKAIKSNKILETYNVSKKALLEFWLSGNNKPIEEQSAFVIEDYMGDKVAFNSKLKAGINALAHYFNNGGSKDSQICKNIVSETVKYNHIADFIVEYKDDYSKRSIIPMFKKIFRNCAGRLNEAKTNFSNALFESLETTINYKDFETKLQDRFGIKHPALKYLAIEEAKREFEKSNILNENIEKDYNSLCKELRHYSNYPSVIASFIVGDGIETKTQINENVDKNNLTTVAKSLYNNICNKTDKVSTAVSSVLFNIIHDKRGLNESKINFLNTLIKYSK